MYLVECCCSSLLANDAVLMWRLNQKVPGAIKRIKNATEIAVKPAETSLRLDIFHA